MTAQPIHTSPTHEEVQKAQELYGEMSKPFIERLSVLASIEPLKLIISETGAESVRVESEVCLAIKQHLYEMALKINADLHAGKFL